MVSSTLIAPALAIQQEEQRAANITRLSSSMFLYQWPLSSADSTDTTAPKLILLATWMDARDVHIAKYIVKYHILYPTANILLVKSTFRYYFSRSSARRNLAPAVHVIRDVIEYTQLPLSLNSKPQMLIHIFSNGGSCMLYHLYDLFAETTTRPVTINDGSQFQYLLPPHVTIFDSVPGRWTYTGSTQAILVSLPSGWVRMMAFPLVHLLGMWWVIKFILLQMPEETHVWGLAHNDKARAQETCRAYVYSEADDFVDHLAVEEHADHAESSGYPIVHRHKFLNSQHVAHARSEPQRYWSLVKETWDVGHQDYDFKLGNTFSN